MQMVAPCLCSSSSNCITASPFLESRFPVGSSASKTGGYPASARATATRCLTAGELGRIVVHSERHVDTLQRPGGHPPPGRGSLGRGFPNHAVDCGNDRACQVPGGPPCAHALLSDPGGTLEPGQLRHSGAAFHGCNGVGFSADCFGAQSHGPCTPRPTLRSPGHPGITQCWVLAAGLLCQVGLLPTGSHCEVSGSTMSSLPPHPGSA